MTRSLWHKKIWNGRSKGISTVLGTVFLTLVVFAISTNVFLWTLSRNAEYTLTVKEENQKNMDRFNERITTSHTTFSPLLDGSDTVFVDVTLFNKGPVAGQVVAMWVVWTYNDVRSYGFDDELDIGLDSGDTASLTIPVTVPGVQCNGTFSGWLVTARGNRVALETQETVVHAAVSAGIGSITMNFTMFKYYEVEGNVLKDYPEGKSGFQVPTGTEIVFAVYLSNYDPEESHIILNSDSLLWAYFPHAPGNPGIWPIVNVASNGTIPDVYDPVVLPFTASKWIFFGPAPLQVKDKSGAVNLILLGMIGDQDYGQNIPFVSIYVYQP